MIYLGKEKEEALSHSGLQIWLRCRVCREADGEREYDVPRATVAVGVDSAHGQAHHQRADEPERRRRVPDRLEQSNNTHIVIRHATTEPSMGVEQPEETGA